MSVSRLSQTPDADSELSSPPPTVINGARRDVSVNVIAKPTEEQLAALSPDLREIVEAMLRQNTKLLTQITKLGSENTKLDIGYREARMSAAHYKLQHNLLTIESEEAVKHLEVEHDMTLREVELLQARVQDAQDPPELDHYRRRCRTLEEENRKLSDNYRKAKRIIISKEDDIIDLEVDNKALRERIRINRAHLNEMRSPGGIYHNPSLHNSPATPQHYRSTPKHTPMTNRSVREGRDHGEPFAALLLADAVLREGNNNSAPSTPVLDRRPIQRTPNRHNRGVQSLSSLPTTPGSARPSSTLLPSAQFSSQSEARVASTLGNGGMAHNSRQRRRKSRDSTISASDTEEIARAAAGGYRQESEEVTESQASQSATEMLRKDPRESFEVAASRTSTPTPVGEKAALLQAKISGYGAVTKPAPIEKRKRGENYNEYTAKRPRPAVGLGLQQHLG